MYAIVEIQGKQYKVAEKDKIEVDKLPKDKGKISFDTVLLYAKDDKDIEIGIPYISGVKVEAEILEQTKGEKITVFKMKPKKRYQKTIGHRTQFTLIEISKILKSPAKTKATATKDE